MLLEAVDVVDDRQRGVLVVLHLGQFEQFACPGQPIGRAADAVDGLVQHRAFPSQRLRAFRVVPDVGVLEFPFYFLKAFALGVVVKETPGANRVDRSGRRCGLEWD